MYDKSPYINRNVKRANGNTNNATKKFDYTAAATDLGRSVGVTTATQLITDLNIFSFCPPYVRMVSKKEDKQFQVSCKLSNLADMLTISKGRFCIAFRG